MKYLDVIEARVKAARILASNTYEESTRKEYELGKLMHRLVDDIEVLLRVVDQMKGALTEILTMPNL